MNERSAIVSDVGSCLAAPRREKGKTWLLSGGPGMGKTHLARRILRHIPAGTTALQASGRIAGTPGLLPVCEAISGYAKAHGREQIEAVLTEYAETVPVVKEIIGPLVRARIKTETVRLQSREVAPSETYSYFILRKIISDLAARTPLLLFFDDIQWFDESSIRFLAYLVQELPALRARVFVLLTTRTNGRERDGVLALRQVLGRVGELGREFVLPPLSPDEIALASEQLLGGICDFTAEDLAWLHLTSKGNPQYLAEVLQLLRQRRTLVELQHRWRFTARSDQIIVPPSLREILSERLERISAVGNEMIRCAAVVGRTFSVQMTAAVSGIDPATTHRELLEVERVDGCIVPTGWQEYRFDHDLTREAIINILGERAAALHRRVAALLEEQSAANIVSAYHWRAAGDAIRAARCYATAAADAFDRAAYAEAAACSKQEDALLQEASLSVDSPQRLHAVANAAEALIAGELYSDAVEILRPRLAAAPARTPKLAHLFGRAAIRAGRAEVHREAVEALQNALVELSADPQAKDEEIEVLTDLVYAFDTVGNFAASRAAYQRAYAAAAQHPNRALLVRVLRLSCIFFQPEKVIEMIEQALSLAEESHLPYETALCQNNLGTAYFHLQQFDAARQLFAQSQSGLIAQGGFRQDTPLNNLGVVALAENDGARGANVLQEALERSIEPHCRIFIRSNLAVATAMQGRLAEATVQLRELVADADATGDLYYRDVVRYNLSAALLRGGFAAEALDVVSACPPHHVTTDDALVAAKRARLTLRAVSALGRSADATVVKSAALLEQTTKPQAWLYRHEWELADIEFWED